MLQISMNAHGRPQTTARKTASASTHHLARTPATVTTATQGATAIHVSDIVDLRDDSLQVKNDIKKKNPLYIPVLAALEAQINL